MEGALFSDSLSIFRARSLALFLTPAKKDRFGANGKETKPRQHAHIPRRPVHAARDGRQIAVRAYLLGPLIVVHTACWRHFRCPCCPDAAVWRGFWGWGSVGLRHETSLDSELKGSAACVCDSSSTPRNSRRSYISFIFLSSSLSSVSPSLPYCPSPSVFESDNAQ